MNAPQCRSTVSTRVCCNMISDTQIAYGSRVRRQGKSRAFASNQRVSARAIARTLASSNSAAPLPTARTFAHAVANMYSRLPGMFRKRDTHIHFVGIGGIGMSGIAEVLVNF